ncbi:glycosyltransferase family 2 protein [Sanguibacter suaedae]|uniref:Glycosyltransferase family 2 protein n=1 Tax=Sanguibacter suaedae TaxID=2795737 RepID=A0A934IBE2_9MICO|nr:glycosyltransferase family 2 protein [Sanguibacter suaedae]MBI9114771.1 glycosyltransferase family 2 protein [Sanguibacter suaedae]
MTPPRVRAVVVTWNGAHLVGPCLDSLLAQDLPDGEVEVVVVDNGSTDGTVALLERDYPGVRVLATGRNLGFAGGVEVGLAGLDSPYAVLLNNDATFEPDAVRLLVEHLDRPENAAVGAATARILLTDQDAQGRVLVNSTGNVLTASGAATDRDWLVPADVEHSPVDVFGFCGGAAALRAAALEEVGTFDPDLFLYYEDTDLSWRMRAAGWSVHYVRGAVAHHQHAASSDATSPLFRFYNTRNSLLVVARHAPWPVVVRSSARQVAGLARHTLARSEDRRLLAARARALIAFVRLLPRTLQRRRAVWSGERRAGRRPVYDVGVGRAD